MERITGPVNGFYIATRSSRSRADAGFLALSKVCRGRPESFSAAYCCARIEPIRAFPTEQEAIADAERRARDETLALLPYAFAKPSGMQSALDRA